MTKQYKSHIHATKTLGKSNLCSFPLKWSPLQLIKLQVYVHPCLVLFSLIYGRKRCHFIRGLVAKRSRKLLKVWPTYFLFLYKILYTFMSWAPLPIFSSLRGWKYKALIKADLSFSSKLWLMGYLQPKQVWFYNEIPAS